MPVAELLLRSIAPFDCLYCGNEGSIVCFACRSKLVYPKVSRCYRCRQATENYATCARCRRHSSLKHVWVGSELNETTKKLLFRFKFERAQEAHKILAATMADSVPSLHNDVIIIPVTTATSRIRRRGYDHTKLLARELAHLNHLSYQNHLIRLNQTRQVGSSRQTRQQQLLGAFRVLHPRKIAGKDVLLVDDVLTSGATLEEAARVLKSAGVRHVAAVVFVHKV